MIEIKTRFSSQNEKFLCGRVVARPRSRHIASARPSIFTACCCQKSRHPFLKYACPSHTHPSFHDAQHRRYRDLIALIALVTPCLAMELVEGWGVAPERDVLLAVGTLFCPQVAQNETQPPLPPSQCVGYWDDF